MCYKFYIVIISKLINIFAVSMINPMMVSLSRDIHEEQAHNCPYCRCKSVDMSRYVLLYEDEENRGIPSLLLATQFKQI